jgi:hypothetical protein
MNVQIWILLIYCGIDIFLFLMKALFLIAVYFYFKIYGGLDGDGECESDFLTTSFPSMVSKARKSGIDEESVRKMNAKQ